MGKKNNKRPKHNKVFSPEKKPLSKENPDTFMNKSICWRFKTIDINEESLWNWNKALQLHKNSKLLNKICDYETMKLSEVQFGINHPIKTYKLNKLAQDELEKRELNDYDRVHSFHVDATTRIYCIPDGNVMSLLWFDPYHSHQHRKKAVCKKI